MSVILIPAKKGFVLNPGGLKQSATNFNSQSKEMFSSARISRWRVNSLINLGKCYRINWKDFLVDQSTRPNDPSDFQDANYQIGYWLTPIFETSAVQDDGILVWLDIRDILSFSPTYVGNSPFAPFLTGSAHYIPDYREYSGPDINGDTDQGSYGPPYVVDEFVAFHQAIYDWLVYNGYDDKVMGIQSYEKVEVGQTLGSAEHDKWRHGFLLKHKLIAQIYAASDIPIYQSSMHGDGREAWQYDYALSPNMGGYTYGIFYPDWNGFKATNSGAILSPFTDPDTSTYMYGQIPICQGMEGEYTTLEFVSGISTAWDYDGSTETKDANMEVYGNCGPPQADPPNDDSSGDLGAHGASGTDPNLGGSRDVMFIDAYSGQALFDHNEWAGAIDIFGPPGTWAIPADSKNIEISLSGLAGSMGIGNLQLKTGVNQILTGQAMTSSRGSLIFPGETFYKHRYYGRPMPPKFIKK